VVLFELRDASKVPPDRNHAATSSGGPGQPVSAHSSSSDLLDGVSAWAVLDVGKTGIHPKDGLQLEMYEYPVDLARRRKKNNPAGVFLSVDLVVTRAEAPNPDGDSADEAAGSKAAAAAAALRKKAGKASTEVVSLANAAPAAVAVPVADIGSKLTALSARLTSGAITPEEFRKLKTTLLTGK
jgi:hypothetical protein